MPLNIAKCQVIRYNERITQNPCHEYYIKGTKLNSVTECIDFGIARTTDCSFRQHISTICVKASRRIGLALRVFQCRHPEFMLQLFKSYARPILEYGVQLWSPTDVGSSDLFERVQRRFTKRIAELGRLSYTDRLQRLSLPSFKSRRTFFIACFVYKLVHNLKDISLHEFGLCMLNTKTHTIGLKLTVPRPLSTSFHNSFVFQAVFI